MALQIVTKVTFVPAIVLIILAAAIGIAGAVIYTRKQWSHMVLSYMCPVVLICFPLMFLSNSHIRDMLKSDPEVATTQ